MVSGALGKISRLCPPLIFHYADLHYFCSFPPLFGASSVGALGSCTSRLALDPPLSAGHQVTGHGC